MPSNTASLAAVIARLLAESQDGPWRPTVASVRAGLDRSYLGKVLSDRPRYRNPSSRTLRAISDALQLSEGQREELARAAGRDPKELATRRIAVLSVPSERPPCSFKNALVFFDALAHQGSEIASRIKAFAEREKREVSCASIYGEHDVVARVRSINERSGADDLITYFMNDASARALVRRTTTLYLRDDRATVLPTAYPEVRPAQYALVMFEAETAFPRGRIVEHVARCEIPYHQRHGLRLLSAAVVTGTYDAMAEVVVEHGRAGMQVLDEFVDNCASYRDPDAGTARLRTVTFVGTPGGWELNLP